MFSIISRPPRSQFHSVSFQNFGLLRFASRMKLGMGTSLECSRFRLNWGNDESGNLREGFNCRSELRTAASGTR
jgi:hypothetical protein